MENAAVLFLSKDLSLEKGCDFKIFFFKNHNITNNILTIFYVNAYKAESIHGNKNKSAREIGLLCKCNFHSNHTLTRYKDNIR